MIESHLHIFVELLCISEKDHSALVITAEDSLNKSARFYNFLVVPLNFEHSPIFLYIYRS